MSHLHGDVHGYIHYRIKLALFFARQRSLALIGGILVKLLQGSGASILAVISVAWEFISPPFKDGTISSLPPFSAFDYEGVEPIYETMPGWKSNTFGVTSWDDLPQKARDYVRRLEELSGVKVAILSTGPERNQTIILEDPFA